MTMPRPRPIAGADAHADLLAALVRGIPAGAGLARIIGTLAHRPAAAEPDRAAHARLLAELTTVLRPPGSLATLLTTESGLAGLAAELTATLDTAGGLTRIVAAASHDARSIAAPAAGFAGEPAAGSPMTDDLTALCFAPAGQRLHLRAGPPSRAAREALRQLENIRVALTRIKAGPHPLDSVLDTVPAVLGRQRERIARAMTVMARGLPSPDPVAAPPPADPPDDLSSMGSLILYIGEAASEEAEGDSPVEADRTTLHVENVVRLDMAFDDSVEVDVVPCLPQHAPAGGSVEEPKWVTNRITDDAGRTAADAAARQREPGEIAGAGTEGSRAAAAGPAVPGPSAVQSVLAEMRRQSDAMTETAKLLAETAALIRDRNGDLEAWLGAQVPDPYECVPSSALHRVAAQSASLLEHVADELALLCDDLTARPPAAAGARLLRGCTRLAGDMTQTVRQLWTALSDFRGADLRAVTEVAVEGLDGVRWSDGTTGTRPTRWPTALASDVQKHSQPVDGFPGVWEIVFGAAVSPGRR